MAIDYRKHTTKDFLQVMSTMERRFKSGNSVPVDSTRITKEEFDIIAGEIEHMIFNMENAALEKFNQEICEAEKEKQNDITT